MARKLGSPGCSARRARDRDLAYALIFSPVMRPASKLSTAAWWGDVTLGTGPGRGPAATDDAYAAMDWLTARQDDIEKELARRHCDEGGIAMFGLSSSWVAAARCELAARGYSRDGKRGKAQIEYGLLTDRHGPPRRGPGVRREHRRPEDLPRGGGRPVRGTFGLEQMIMVGDRGMITSRGSPSCASWTAWPGSPACAAPAIKKLMSDGGPLELSLFDERDLAEISAPGLPRGTADRLP